MKAIERLYQYIDYKDYKPTIFEKEIGLSSGYLSVQKKRNADIGETVLNKINDYCHDINIEWLLTGKGEMLKSAYHPIDRDKFAINSIQGFQKGREILKDVQAIPLFEIEASAGLTIFFNNQDTQIPLDYISIPNAPKCDGAIFVRGDSMYPLLKAGDIVCYKIISDIKNILWGEMYLLDIDSGEDQFLTIKYVQKSDLGNDYVKLVSENRHHQHKDEPIKNIRALAIVKLSIRYNAIS